MNTNKRTLEGQKTWHGWMTILANIISQILTFLESGVCSDRHYPVSNSLKGVIDLQMHSCVILLNISSTDGELSRFPLARKSKFEETNRIQFIYLCMYFTFTSFMSRI